MMQMQTPPFTKTNKFILIAALGVFLINSILGEFSGVSLVNYLGLSSNMVIKGFVTQFFTYPLMETGFMSMLFNGLLLWFIGSELEMLWGEKFYRKYILMNILVVGVVYFLVSLINSDMTYVPLKGLTGVNFAMLVAYGLIFSERQLTFMLLFPMKAKYFCMLLAGIEVYMSLFSSYKYSAWAHLLAMVFGFTYLRYASMKSRLGNLKKETHKKKMKSKLKLVKDDEDEPKTWH